MNLRIGQGFDVHSFSTEPGPIKIGGVAIDHPVRFLAHSDGDVLIHAICDALLGALALGDIGKHFPDSDERFKNIDSLLLLKYTYELINNHGYKLVNLDSVVIAEQPKLSPYILAIRKTIGQILEIEIEAISVKATTSEKLGFTGRGEGIAAQAICLITTL